jgi:hypothetical protein
MLIFVEAGQPELFVKAVGQSVKNKKPKIDYTPSKSAKSQASKAVKNSDPDVQKQIALAKKKTSAV